MNITVYSTSTCGICHALMQWLEKEEFEYKKVVVDEDDNAMTGFLEVSDGAIGVPFTVITKDDGSTEKLAGFDKSKFQTILGIA